MNDYDRQQLREASRTVILLIAILATSIAIVIEALR